MQGDHWNINNVHAIQLTHISFIAFTNLNIVEPRLYLHRGNSNICMWIKCFFNRITRGLFWNAWGAPYQVKSNGDLTDHRFCFDCQLSRLWLSHARGQSHAWHWQRLWATVEFGSKMVRPNKGKIFFMWHLSCTYMQGLARAMPIRTAMANQSPPPWRTGK